MSHHVTAIIVSVFGNEYRITKTKIETSDGRTLRRDACRAALAAILDQSPESVTRHRSTLLKARHWYPAVPQWQRYCDQQAFNVLTLAHAPGQLPDVDSVPELVATRKLEPTNKFADLPSSLTSDPIDIDEWLDSGHTVSELFDAMSDVEVC